MRPLFIYLFFDLKLGLNLISSLTFYHYFLNKTLGYYVCVYDCFAFTYVCVPGDLGGQKRVLNSLELELEEALSCCVGTGNNPSPL